MWTLYIVFVISAILLIYLNDSLKRQRELPKFNLSEKEINDIIKGDEELKKIVKDFEKKVNKRYKELFK